MKATSMRTIDKTSSSKNNKWDYGTILKCWNDDPNTYGLYRIASSHDLSKEYELDILHSLNDNEGEVWFDYYQSIEDLEKDVLRTCKHVLPVKATIIIEDL